MAVDKVHVAADGFVEEFEDAITRMLARHGSECVGEVLDEGEDHDCGLDCSVPGAVSSSARLPSRVTK